MEKISHNFFHWTMYQCGYAPIGYSINTLKGVFRVQNYTVIGSWENIAMLRKFEPTLSLAEIELVLQGRTFTRWYRRNKKTVNALALVTPVFAMSMFGISPGILPALLFGKAVPAGMASVTAMAAAGSGDFWSGHMGILLHMLVLGFVTLVITTFLKFTGRGDLAPLVVFVGGGAILYEVIGMFKDIYNAVAMFFQM
jgi:hypothetical protein